jgi:hypothetical protein
MLDLIEYFSSHKFIVFENSDDDYPSDKWYSYNIYDENHNFDFDHVSKFKAESDCNGFDTEQEARFAAIGHITQLEKDDK